MNPKTLCHLALDVFREALSSKIIWFVLVMVALLLVGIGFFFKLEVIDGAMAAARLMGGTGSASYVPVDVVLRPVLGGMSSLTMVWGLIFGIIGTAEIVPRMLGPGRVEHLLSLPIRRSELLLGTCLGVLMLGGSIAFVVNGGLSVILSVKTGVLIVAPVVGTAFFLVAFAGVYFWSAAIGTLTRSSTFAGGFALFLCAMSLLRDSKSTLLGYIRDSSTRSLADGLLSVFPNLPALGELAATVAKGEPVIAAAAVPLVVSVLLFGAVGLVLGILVIQTKDH
jgi:ABC-type transport system involved in multi-copper enzyme maturation permease subunit